MPTGRFAPSPTGPLHLGNLRTALVAWLFARSTGGRFLLRFEDLDTAASRPEHFVSQERDLAAIGLDWDGPALRQSERRAHHDDAVRDLERRGLTYACYCSRREVREAAQAPHGELPEGGYPGTCRILTARDRAERQAAGRPPALRLRAEEATAAFNDLLHGRQVGVVDDFVLRRGDGVPSYNVAVVIDDAAQGVEEVVRGDDLLSTTSRQVLLARLLHLDVPQYAHVPLVLAPDGNRLAKRDGAVTLGDRQAMGEDAADVVSMLAASLRLSAPRERVTASDLIARFDPKLLPRTPWVLTALELGLG
jgi:glutamyl-tRNA synthetase